MTSFASTAFELHNLGAGVIKLTDATGWQNLGDSLSISLLVLKSADSLPSKQAKLCQRNDGSDHPQYQ